MNDNLITDSLDLSGRKIEVKEATGLASIQRSRMFEELSATPHPDEYVQAFLLNVYVNLACCSNGDIPKGIDEFLDMRESDIEKWTVAARKLNPHWFAWLDNAEKIIGELSQEQVKSLTPQQKEKKSQKLSKSS